MKKIWFSFVLGPLVLLHGTYGWCGADRQSWLESQYGHTRRQNPRGVSPLRIDSSEQDGHVVGEVYGVVEEPFSAVSDALTAPASWCEIASFNLNIKGCSQGVRGRESFLTLYVGRKSEDSPQESSELVFQYRIEEQGPFYFRLLLSAEKGPLGTEDHRIELEGIPVPGGSFLHFISSYRPSFLSRVATQVYLKTVGRNKIGFTVVDTAENGDPVYVKGLKGMIERNAMRYYLALKTYLKTRFLPSENRFEAGLSIWFDLTEQYSTQLHEMERSDYIEQKRKERANLLKMSQGG